MTNPVQETVLRILETVRALLPEFLADPIDQKHSGGNVSVCIVDGSGQVHGQMFGDDPIRKRDSGHDGVASHDFIEERRTAELTRRHGRTRDDHVERSLEADGARQALGAAGTGKDAQLHLRQRNLSVRRRDAEMAAERELQAAAHAKARDGGEHRLVAGLDHADERMERRLALRLGGVELANVGAGGERSAGTRENDRLNRRIGQRAVDGCGGSDARLVREPVDRRIVERDDGDAVARIVARADGSAP